MERPTAWERLRRVNPYIWDALLAVFVCGVTLVLGSSLYGDVRTPQHGIDLGPVTVVPSYGPPAALLIGAGCLPLVWRRRAPIGTLAVTAVVAATYQLAGFPEGLVAFPLVVAAYTAAAHRERKLVLAAATPIALGAGLTIALVGGEGPRGRIEILFILMVTVGLPLLFGRIAYNRRRRIERDRERSARDAVSGERTRIARELHDAVAHSMGVMVVQAGAARVVMERDPAETAAALRRIEETGRSGLTEMRRLVGILETDDGSASLAPQPGLEQLDELLETFRGTGLPVEAMVEGTPRDLPPGVDLTAFRLVQEGLTNALKHAGDAHARVLLRYGEDALEVEIADDGRGPPQEGAESAGHGLIGMRERVAVFGGSIETRARPGGGFVVRAWIPLAEAT